MAKTLSMASARKQIIAAIHTNAEAAITAAPPEVEAFADAVQTLSSALINLSIARDSLGD